MDFDCVLKCAGKGSRQRGWRESGEGGGVCFTFNDSIAGMNHHQRSSALPVLASVICQSFVPALSLIES